MDAPNLQRTGPFNSHPSLESPPAGVEVVRSGEDSVTIHHRRTGMGCLNAFLLIWLTGWTVGCVMLLVNYLGGGKMESGTPISLWFVVIFWVAEIAVAFFVVKLVFERSSFQLNEETLTIERTMLGHIGRSVVSKASIRKVIQVKDGGTGEDSFPSWGLRVAAEKTHSLIYRQPHEQSEWLGQLIADWAGKKFDGVPEG